MAYGIEIYGNTCPTYLHKLTKINNKILRILQNILLGCYCILHIIHFHPQNYIVIKCCVWFINFCIINNYDDDCSDSGLEAPNSNSLQWTNHG